MVERRQIIELWKRAPIGILVTLVRVEGSSYRRPGARLLLAPGTAEHVGTLSGGCLEADVLRRAPFLIRNGAAVERYATTFDDTADIPFGLGCGGIVDLLFEPCVTPEGTALLESMEASLSGEERKVVTFLPGGDKTLRRAIFSGTGDLLFASPELNHHKLVCARAMEPISVSGRLYEGRFAELLASPQRLFILGAGEDARPLADLAARLGWTVIVADGRSHFARAERFPGAARILTLSPDSAHALGVEPRDAVILMTHSYEQDRSLLASMLQAAPRYLGILGSRHRSSILVAETAALLGHTVESCCDSIFAPVGMDLGGDEPESIALSILAEVQAVRSGKAGGSRRLSAADVAAQIARGGASLYLQSQCALDIA